VPVEDLPCCPKTKPTELTPAELRIMRDMVMSTEYRHFSITALAIHAQRIGKLFAAPQTWLRAIRLRGWTRPLKRLYPMKPRIGIRASVPGELLHIDVTLFRLVDGTKLFLHAVIDNMSRKILAWELAEKLSPLTSCKVLQEAISRLPIPVVADGAKATLLADGGVENINADVDALLKSSPLDRVIAQVEIAYSNSMIEAWWRRLKHGWLFLHALDSVATARRLIAFYVEQHNTVMPHSALRGRTPSEVFHGTALDLDERLAEAKRLARAARIQANRTLECGDCRELIKALHAQDPAGIQGPRC
jgi:putative transposase